jgi:hypothetical protein
MKIKASLSIGFVGAKHQVIINIDDEDLEGLDQDEKNKVIEEKVNEWAWNHIDLNWEEME